MATRITDLESDLKDKLHDIRPGTTYVRFDASERGGKKIMGSFVAVRVPVVGNEKGLTRRVKLEIAALINDRLTHVHPRIRNSVLITNLKCHEFSLELVTDWP